MLRSVYAHNYRHTTQCKKLLYPTSWTLELNDISNMTIPAKDVIDYVTNVQRTTSPIKSKQLTVSFILLVCFIISDLSPYLQGYSCLYAHYNFMLQKSMQKGTAQKTFYVLVCNLLFLKGRITEIDCIIYTDISRPVIIHLQNYWSHSTPAAAALRIYYNSSFIFASLLWP